MDSTPATRAPLDYEQALAEQAYLIVNAGDLLTLHLREYHAYGLVHGYHGAGRITDATRDADLRNVGTIAQNRRATLVEHDGIDPRTAALSLCTRIDPAVIERPA